MALPLEVEDQISFRINWRFGLLGFPMLLRCNQPSNDYTCSTGIPRLAFVVVRALLGRGEAEECKSSSKMQDASLNLLTCLKPIMQHNPDSIYPCTSLGVVFSMGPYAGSNLKL